MISLDDTFFGNTIIQYGYLLVSVLVALLLGKVVLFLIQNHFKKIASTTHTKIDDLLLYTIETPIHLSFFIIGAFFGMTFLTVDQILFPLIDNIMVILLYLNLAWYALRLSDSFLDVYIVPLTKRSKSKLDDQLLPILRNVLKYGIVILSFLIILDNIGMDVTALIAGLGIGGIALAMASQDLVSNIFGGITIFADKPFTIGDWVKFGEYSGTIEEVGVRSSRLRTFDGALVTIPNNSFSTSPVENISKRGTERVVMNLGFTYDTPVKKMKQAKELIKEAITSTAGTDHEKYYISFQEFGDFALKVLVVYYVTDLSSYEKRLEIRDEVNMKIKELTEKNGIEMAFPTQTIYTKKA